MVLFRYCSLGDDTAMLGGLRARLRLAFLVFIHNLVSYQSYHIMLSPFQLFIFN